MGEETRRDEADKNCEVVRRQFFMASRQAGRSEQTIVAQAKRITELEAENAKAKALLRIIHQVGYFRREIDAFMSSIGSQKDTPHD